MVLLLYPSVTALIDAQNAINNYLKMYTNATQALLTTRNNLVMQVSGFVFLYLFLGILLYLQPTQQDNPNSQWNQPTVDVKQSPNQIVETKIKTMNVRMAQTIQYISYVISIAIFFSGLFVDRNFLIGYNFGTTTHINNLILWFIGLIIPLIISAWMEIKKRRYKKTS